MVILEDDTKPPCFRVPFFFDRHNVYSNLIETYRFRYVVSQAEKHNPKAHTFSGGTRSVWAIAIQAMPRVPSYPFAEFVLQVTVLLDSGPKTCAIHTGKASQKRQSSKS